VWLADGNCRGSSWWLLGAAGQLLRKTRGADAGMLREGEKGAVRVVDVRWQRRWVKRRRADGAGELLDHITEHYKRERTNGKKSRSELKSVRIEVVLSSQQQAREGREGPRRKDQHRSPPRNQMSRREAHANHSRRRHASASPPPITNVRKNRCGRPATRPRPRREASAPLIPRTPTAGQLQAANCNAAGEWERSLLAPARKVFYAAERRQGAAAADQRPLSHGSEWRFSFLH
jgi:hypothetical protein